MNCREFESLVLDLARHQLLEVTARTQALQHAELCVGCAARLAEERVLLSNVQLVVTVLTQQEVPAYIEANLLTALRDQSERHPITPSPLPKVAPWWSWKFAATAFAAMLLLALLVKVTGRNFNEPEIRQQAQQSPVPSRPSTPQSVAVAEKVVTISEPKPVNVSVSRAQPRRSVRPPLVATRIEATPFYSLVEEGAGVQLESGRIVRVEVPAATLIPYGLPVTAEALSQPVQADLLLGQDGLARAIRFLPTTQNTKTQ